MGSVEEIDQHNILATTLESMTRAHDLLHPAPAYVLIDGNKAPWLPCPHETIVKGDGKSLSIAAASIIAKVTRDRIMKKLDLEFPGYGWASNKGYGTKTHQEGLDSLGVTQHHRRSFKPIHNMLCVDSR